ncbi:MAG: hypothetical protein PWQ37_2339 [Candidatus Petromonas sp.]|jgi:Zn-dependent peptidase ImmA (M78 family)/DNA-binding XRE family transcriptional regulator|nr:hypothetical protein [Candidatus Petromonas sp.]
MKSTREFNSKRLRNARLYRAKTISDLAEDVGVSKQAISQYENGRATPSFETLLKIVNSLRFPKEYFYEGDKLEIKVRNTYFRSLLTTNKKDRIAQVAKIKLLSSLYHFLSMYVEFPKLNLPNLNFEGKSIEDIAMEIREYWGLGEQPISNVIRVLEKNGIIITSFDTESDFIDAFSQKQEINKKEYYFIVLGNDKKSAVRRQFDAAHELGHILLHDWALDIEQISREEFRQIEKEANLFAAEFLLPKKSFIKDLIYPTELDFYIELKKKWKVSISSMIVRSYQLKVINYNQYQYMMRKISKNGWKRKEPLDDIIQIPKPIVFKKAIKILLENNIFTGPEILRELSNYGLSLDRKEVEVLLGLDSGTLIDTNKNSPVVSIRNKIKKA